MENQNFYIVEDMGVTRAALVSVLQRAGYQYVGSASAAENAWLEIPQKNVTVVIIDVNLKGAKDGIWLAKKIRESLNCAIVFLTAYGSDAMLEKIHSTDPDGYIMKPFNNPTLISSVKMACRNLQKRNKEKNPVKVIPTIIKSRSGLVKINKADLVYLKSEGNYVHLKTASITHEVRGKLDEVLKMLDYENLYRIHRRYAVNVEKIKAIDRNSILVSINKELPVSKSFNYEELIKRLNLDLK